MRKMNFPSAKALLTVFLFFFAFKLSGEQKIINVEIDTVRFQNVSQSETYVGELRAFKDFTVKTLNEGYIEYHSPLDVGSRVEKGKVLAKIDTGSAKDSLDKAYVNLERTILDIINQEKNYQSILYNIQIAKEQLDFAKADFERDKALYDKKILSEKLFLTSENNFKTKSLQYQLEKQKLIQSEGDTQNIPKFETLAKYRAKRGRVQELVLKPDPKINYLPLLSAHVAFNSAKIDYDIALKNHGDTILKSPANGLVVERNKEPLEFSDKGSVLYRVAILDPILVTFNVRETELGEFPVGKKVNVLLDAFPNEKMSGKVSEVGLIADQQSRRFLVELTLSNSRNRFRPGMTARVNLNKSAGKRYIMIPLVSLIQSHKENFVYVAENNKAKKVQVQIGEIILNKVQVLGGLDKGQELIVQGNRFLKDGDPIRILNPR